MIAPALFCDHTEDGQTISGASGSECAHTLAMLVNSRRVFERELETSTEHLHPKSGIASLDTRLLGHTSDA